jgi:PEP-CTERM motif
MRKLYALAALAASALLATQAYAQTNEPPPAGNVIYQLTGQPILGTYTPGTASFVATNTSTNLTFAFREDPAYLQLSNVTLTDTTTSGPNLLLNGDFSLGPTGSQAPTDWSYLNVFGAGAGGVVESGCGLTGNNCYVDGAVQAYDAISQVIATTVGDTYQVSFDYSDTDPGGIYQPLSTNGDVTDPGGNGRDMFIYAGTVPVKAPEPASMALLGAGLAGLGAIRRKRTR